MILETSSPTSFLLFTYTLTFNSNIIPNTRACDSQIAIMCSEQDLELHAVLDAAIHTINDLTEVDMDQEHYIARRD